ncbi:MAG: hypothetical protein AAF899_02890 [Pseudomonadota bacterium]
MARASELAAALALHREGRLEEAVERYEAICRAAPLDPDVVGLIGITQQQRGRLEVAARWLDQALALGGPDRLVIRNLNARAIIEKEAGRLKTLPEMIARHRPAGPLDPPAEAADIGAYISLALLDIATRGDALADDLATACLASIDLATPVQWRQIAVLLASLGRRDDLEAFTTEIGNDDPEMARTLWLAAWPAAEKASHWDIGATARFTICQKYPVLRDRRPGTEGTALRVLVLRSPPPHLPVPEVQFNFGGNTIGTFIAGYHETALAFDSYILGGSAVPTTVETPDGIDLIFNNVANAELAVATGAQAMAETIAKRAQVPVLNPPAEILKTTRVAIARLLDGIEGLVVPKIVNARCDPRRAASAARRLVEQLGLPMIVRSVNEHGGRNMSLCMTVKEVQTALTMFEGKPFYAIEYVDTQVEQGVWRKFRMAFIDGAPFAHKLQFGETWNVHGPGWYEIFERRADLVEEETRFVDDGPGYLGPEAMATLDAIRKRIDLDFFGVDFAFDSAGKMVLFEANAAMRTVPVWDSKKRQRMAHLEGTRKRIRGAFERLLLRKAQEGRAARLATAH